METETGMVPRGIYWWWVLCLLSFRHLLARVCGSMARFSGNDGKTTLFSSAVGKLHLSMFNSMTGFIIIIFFLWKNVQMSKYG